MKITKSILIVLFVLSVAQVASAYYCPSTGRWLSRDPIGETGFQVLRTAAAIPQTGSPGSLQPSHWIKRDSFNKPKPEEPNLYIFANNNSVSFYDSFGLSCNCPPKKPSGGTPQWDQWIRESVRGGDFTLQELLDNGVPQDYIKKMAQYYEDVGECNEKNDPRVKKLNDCRAAYLRGERTKPCGSTMSPTW